MRPSPDRLRRALAFGTLLLAQAALAQSPPRRAHHALVYDEESGRILMTGGSTPSAGGGCCTFFNDLWAFDGSQWTALPSSGTLMSGMRLAFDTQNKRVLSFGGYAAGRSMPDLRTLERNEWKALAPHPEMSAAEPGVAFDSRRNRLVVFGGSAGRGQTNTDTWEHDGSAWSKVAQQGPGARQVHAMAFDERRGRTVVFGGSGVAAAPGPPPVLGDLWEFDGERWHQIATTDGPSPRHSAGVTYDSKRGLVIVFGGYATGGTFLADLWAWNGTRWSKLADASPNGPAPRVMGYIAFDKRRDRVVLFGGRKGWPDDLADTWEWDGTAWKQVAGAGAGGQTR